MCSQRTWRQGLCASLGLYVHVGAATAVPSGSENEDSPQKFCLNGNGDLFFWNMVLYFEVVYF